MTISLDDGGKRFNREWIFRHATLQFSSGKSYAITGPNGSGKSTLLQTLGGMLQLSEGTLTWKEEGLTPEQAYRQISFCAPYQELIEEMTLTELLTFHQQFKPFLPGLTISSIIDLLGLGAAAGRQLRNYSSGMKQRVKLAQALLSHTAIILLDEPCSNLDEAGIRLYHSLVSTYAASRLLIVCSNDPVEYSFASQTISILQYK
jgi:ABC-type multidrug transport system ATPase subunit